MTSEHLGDGALQACRLAGEICAHAAAGLTRLRRQLHPIDGKHLPCAQSLPIAQIQHLRNELRNRLARERDERHVLAAGTLDRAVARSTGNNRGVEKIGLFRSIAVSLTT